MKWTSSLRAFILCMFLWSIICSSTVLPIFGLSSGIATSSISSNGIISYSPTPTPSPTPNSKNLAVIPDYWNDPNAWGLRQGGYCYYPVTWQGHTCMEISRNPEYISWLTSMGWVGAGGMNEMNGYHTYAKPGDHIVFSAWIWTENPTIAEPTNYYGAYLGIDIYTGSTRIVELDGPNGIAQTAPNWPNRMFVHWGSNAWVQLKMDFIVQSTYISDANGQAVVPDGFVCMLAPFGQPNGNAATNEAANFYVYGTELYINP